MSKQTIPPRIVGISVSPIMGEALAELSIQALAADGKRIVCRFFMEPDTAAMLAATVQAWPLTTPTRCFVCRADPCRCPTLPGLGLASDTQSPAEPSTRPESRPALPGPQKRS